MTTPALICTFCGAVPAREFAIRRHVGMLIVQQFIKVKRPMCRDHARQLVKHFTLKTLWQGWWGYISFFVNWFVLAANAAVFVRAGKLGAPQLPMQMPQTTFPQQPAEGADTSAPAYYTG
jgi:hypothetical protein